MINNGNYSSSRGLLPQFRNSYRRRKQCIKDGTNINKPKNQRPPKAKRSLLSLDRTPKTRLFSDKTKQKQRKLAHGNHHAKVFNSLKRYTNGHNFMQSLSRGLDSLLVQNMDTIHQRNRNFLGRKKYTPSQKLDNVFDISDADEEQNTRCYCKYCLNRTDIQPVHCRYHSGCLTKSGCRGNPTDIEVFREMCHSGNIDLPLQGRCENNKNEATHDMIKGRVNAKGKDTFETHRSDQFTIKGNAGENSKKDLSETPHYTMFPKDESAMEKTKRLKVEVNSSNYWPNWQTINNEKWQHMVSRPLQWKNNEGCENRFGINDNEKLIAFHSNGRNECNKNCICNRKTYNTWESFKNTIGNNDENRDSHEKITNLNCECCSPHVYSGNTIHCPTCLRQTQNINTCDCLHSKNNEDVVQQPPCCCEQEHGHNRYEYENCSKFCSNKGQHSITEKCESEGNKCNFCSTKHYSRNVSDHAKENSPKTNEEYVNNSIVCSKKQQYRSTKIEVANDDINKQDRRNVSKQNKEEGERVKCCCCTSDQHVSGEKIGSKRPEDHEKIKTNKIEQGERRNSSQSYATKQQRQPNGKSRNWCKIYPEKETFIKEFLTRSFSHMEVGKGINRRAIDSENIHITMCSDKSQTNRYRHTRKCPSCSDIQMNLESALERNSMNDGASHREQNSKGFDSRQSENQPRSNSRRSKATKNSKLDDSDLTMSSLLKTLREKCKGTDTLTLKVVKMPKADGADGGRMREPKLKLRMR